MKKKNQPFDIPGQFNLGPFTVKVKIDRKLYDEEKEVGVCHVGQQVLTLQPPGENISDDLFFQCFLHELFHQILFTVGGRRLYTDEILVDNLASAMFQFLRTKRGTAWRFRK